MKLRVYSLIVETSRMCNFQCEHCLRGNSETEYLREKTIEQIKDQIDEVYEFVPGGGEPFIDDTAISYLQQLLSLVKEKGCDCVYIPTNGTVDPLQPDIVDTIKLILSFLELRNDENLEGTFHVKISRDQYHKDQGDYHENWDLFGNWVSKENQILEDHQIIQMGRAERYGLGQHPYPRQLSYEYMENYDTLDIDTLYVTTTGYCFSSCDLSYDVMETYMADEGHFPAIQEVLNSGSEYLGHISTLKDRFQTFIENEREN